MLRMLRAELLKLRRNRAVWLGAAATVLGLPFSLLGLVLLASGTLRVDGGEFAGKVVEGLYGPGLVGAALIGVAGGTTDRTSGVLRTLVATGRPRAHLFWIRLPAVALAAVLLSLALWVVAVALGFALSDGSAVLGDAPRLTGAEAWELLPQIVAIDVVLAASTLGICSAGLSAAPAIGGVLGLALGVMPMVALSSSTPDWLLGLMRRWP